MVRELIVRAKNRLSKTPQAINQVKESLRAMKNIELERIAKLGKLERAGRQSHLHPVQAHSILRAGHPPEVDTRRTLILRAHRTFRLLPRRRITARLLLLHHLSM